MSQLFNNKYRIPSARLRNWNYANEAMYFVTICTKNRKNYFGEIVGTPCMASLQPTDLGKIAHSEWYKSIELRSDMNLELGEFVVMPNHIHGIIIIGANQYNSKNRGAMNGDSTKNSDTDAMHGVSTKNPDTAARHGGSTKNPDTAAMRGGSINRAARLGGSAEYKNQFAPQSKNLSSIIRGYKSAVTTFARKNGIDFDWQTRFHDHIIRSMPEYHRISNYIINNPTKWVEDKFHLSHPKLTNQQKTSSK